MSTIPITAMLIIGGSVKLSQLLHLYEYLFKYKYILHYYSGDLSQSLVFIFTVTISLRPKMCQAIKTKLLKY